MPVKLPEPFPPLPSLPVIRDTWCSQEMTDTVIRFLQQRRPDLIEHVAREQNIARDSTYHKWIDRALYFLANDASNEIALPSTRLGRLDLMYELSRRIAKASGHSDLELIGNPIAEGPDKPLPPLPDVRVLKIDKISQDLLDKVMRAIYERRPDILYELGEQQRRMIVLNEIDGQLMTFRHQVLDKEFSIPDDTGIKVEILAHARLRVHLMMGQPYPEHLKQYQKE